MEGYAAVTRAQSVSNLVLCLARRALALGGRRCCNSEGQLSGMQVLMSSSVGNTALHVANSWSVSRQRDVARMAWTVDPLRLWRMGWGVFFRVLSMFIGTVRMCSPVCGMLS